MLRRTLLIVLVGVVFLLPSCAVYYFPVLYWGSFTFGFDAWIVEAPADSILAVLAL
jgi:hypothetical protein